MLLTLIDKVLIFYTAIEIRNVNGKRSTILGGNSSFDMSASLVEQNIEPQVFEGLSWSQLIMFMHLVCLNDIGIYPQYFA